MKVNVRLLCRTAVLLALCVASQFLKNTSVYITGSIVNAILILATLSCGILSAAILSVVTPLTAWLITGSPLMSAIPLLAPGIMLGNLVLVVFVWIFARFIRKRFHSVGRMSFSDDRFRIGLLVPAVAGVLWVSLCIVFASTLGDLLQVENIAPIIVTVLIAAGGTFVLFVCLWMLIARFPDTWSLIAGMVFGAVFKAIAMWLVIVKGILPAFGPDCGLPAAALGTASTVYSSTQLLTALIGSVLALLIWLPLKNVLTRTEH